MTNPNLGNSLLLSEKQKRSPSIIPININGVINRAAYLMQQNANFDGIPCDVTENDVRNKCKQLGLFDIHLFYDARSVGYFSNSKTLNEKLAYHAKLIAKSAIINFYQLCDLCEAMDNKINMQITVHDLKKTVRHHLKQVCSNTKAIESAITEMKIGNADILGYKNFYSDWSFVFKKFDNDPTISDGKNIRISVYGAGHRETSYDTIFTYDNKHILYLPQQMKTQLCNYYIQKSKDCKKFIKDSLSPYFPTESLEKLFTQLRKYKYHHKNKIDSNTAYDLDFIKAQMQKVLKLYPNQIVFKKSFDQKQEAINAEKAKAKASDFDNMLSLLSSDDEFEMKRAV